MNDNGKLNVGEFAARESGDDFIDLSAEHVRQMLEAGLPDREILMYLAKAGEALAGSR